MSQKQLQKLLDGRVSPGDVVRIGSGIYDALPHENNVLLTVRRGGTSDRPLTIAGVDTGDGLPLIRGKWKSSNVRYHAHSAVAIAVAKTAPHVVIKDLRIASCMTAIRARSANLALENIVVEKSREAIRLIGVTDATLARVRATRYTKRGFTMEKGVTGLVLTGCHADATGGDADWPVEAYPFGFQVGDDKGNADVRFVACSSRNNIFPDSPGNYWNGDGFSVESSAVRIAYVDCLSVNNGDGGWDDKSLAPVFERCTAVGNKRGFRIWNVNGGPDKPARLTDCLAVNNKSHGGSGSSAGFWTNGVAEIRHSTFHNNHFAAVSVEHRDKPARVALFDCILSSDADHLTDRLIRTERHTEVHHERTTLWREGREGEDPGYRAPSTDWAGTPPDAYVSTTHGDTRGRRFR